jgi:acyl-CoA synthetase (NDP forming)
MTKINKSFFDGQEVLFIGFSEKEKTFCEMVYKAFSDNGIKVYPLNKRKGASFDRKVYTDLAELPAVPETAYVLLNKENSGKAVAELAERGVRKIMFQGRGNVAPGTLEKCRELGIEAVVACPMMIFGKGLHKIHAFFAGVRS